MSTAPSQRGIETILTLAFGHGGNAVHHLGGGWSAEEPDGRWMVGPASEIWLENPGPGGDLLLEVEVGLMHGPAGEPRQRLAVGVRDKAIAQIRPGRGGTLAFHVPAALFAAPGPVRLLFVHPDFRRPIDLGEANDDRQLSFHAKSLRLSRVLPRPHPVGGAPLPADEMITRFESLGDNCEFGLVQRRLGAEPLGLCRFSFTELPMLLRGLRSGFAGLAEPGTVHVSMENQDREFVVTEDVFKMTYHTFETADNVDIETVRARQIPRLTFLRRKLMEDAAAGTKIFVIKRGDPLPPEEVLPVYTALNELGRNWLLWMRPADQTHPAGTVEHLLPGLLRGYVDRFAPYDNAPDVSLDSWRTVCENAWRMAGGSVNG